MQCKHDRRAAHGHARIAFMKCIQDSRIAHARQLLACSVYRTGGQPMNSGGTDDVVEFSTGVASSGWMLFVMFLDDLGGLGYMGSYVGRTQNTDDKHGLLLCFTV
jgi:hypothetical protein